MTVLREDLLRDATIALAGGDATAVLGDRLLAAGAVVERPEVGLEEDVAEQWARDRGAFRALVVDTRNDFSDGGVDALRLTLERAWGSLRPIASGSLIPAGDPAKIVLVCPRPDAGAHAEAARSALVNLARTLSVEWARYRVSTVAVLPGAITAEEELAELICFLVSPAGEYFSGCRLDLGNAQPATRR